MCGRFGQVDVEESIVQQYGFDIQGVIGFESNYNTDIGNKAIIVANDNSHQLVRAVFGYTPVWEKSMKYIFNARTEGDNNKENSPDYDGEMGIFSKPYFRNVILKKRCVIPVNYFVEGPEKERLSKPYVIKRADNKSFLLGGIYEYWTDKESGEIVNTFAILTTANTPLLAKVGHHRAPLIIPDDKMEWWLSNDRTKNELSEFMKPFDDADFLAFPVDAQLKKKNIKQSNNSPSLIEPIGAAFSA